MSSLQYLAHSTTTSGLLSILRDRKLTIPFMLRRKDYIENKMNVLDKCLKKKMLRIKQLIRTKKMKTEDVNQELLNDECLIEYNKELELIFSDITKDNYVFFTPISKEFINEIMKVSYASHYLVFDLESLLNDYPMYFINTKNNYGPSSGKGYGKNNRCTECDYTYHSNEFRKKLDEIDSVDIKKHILEEDTCVRTEEEIMDIIERIFPQNNEIYDVCDGGPEIGVYPNDSSSIIIQPYIRKILVNKSKLSETQLEKIYSYGIETVIF